MSNKKNTQTTPPHHDAFRSAAAQLQGIDVEVYRACGKDPLDPIVGLGERRARVGFFGRDPGRDEVIHGMPFIGAGGQKVRASLYRHLYGSEMPDFEASVAVGRLVFWANTVPYKPVGNKAWSTKAKKLIQPLMADLLVHAWDGRDMITLGREAFLWFGINQARETRQALEAFWERGDRFDTSIETVISALDGAEKVFRLHPLPHPSPLNATWYKRFPALLEARLAQLSLTPDSWRVG